MKIEDEIRVKRFESEAVKAQVNILFTASWLYNWVLGRLRPYALSHEQFNALRILRGQHPNAICQKDILSRMIDRNSNLTKIVRKLKDKGFVHVEKSEEDRREYNISITEKGLELLALIDEDFKRDPMPLEHLSPSECFHLNALLDKAREGGA